MIALPKRFVCLDCGARFEIRRWLEAHWYALGHSPEKAQADAVARARGNR